MWYRLRALGGRMDQWGQISLCMGPCDFKPFSRSGRGPGWPISSEDHASFYAKIGELIEVFGTAEGLENMRDSKLSV